MGFAVVLAAAACLLALPMSLELSACTGPKAGWSLRLLLWGHPLPAFTGKHRHKRHRTARAHRPGVPDILRALRSVKGVLSGHVHITRLDAWGRLGGADAARAALLSGAANTLPALIRPLLRGPVRICVLPDFSGAPTCLCFRCMIRFRLGILIAGVLFFLLALLREEGRTSRKKEAA